MTNQRTEASPLGFDIDNRRTRARVLQRAVPPPEDDQLTWRYAAHMVASDSLALADALDALRTAARAVIAEWDERGDGGCTRAVQDRLRVAVGGDDG